MRLWICLLFEAGISPDSFKICAGVFPLKKKKKEEKERGEMVRKDSRVERVEKGNFTLKMSEKEEGKWRNKIFLGLGEENEGEGKRKGKWGPMRGRNGFFQSGKTGGRGPQERVFWERKTKKRQKKKKKKITNEAREERA